MSPERANILFKELQQAMQHQRFHTVWRIGDPITYMPNGPVVRVEDLSLIGRGFVGIRREKGSGITYIDASRCIYQILD